MPWSQPFEDPIPLPDGGQLVTLEDAAAYIQKLPKAEHDLEHWRTAVEMLILAAEDRRPTMFARIGMMRALNHGKPAPMSRNKRAKVYKIVRSK
jgi:hypothetical protein